MQAVFSIESENQIETGPGDKKQKGKGQGGLEGKNLPLEK